MSFDKTLKRLLLIFVIVSLGAHLSGCVTPAKYLEKEDDVVHSIIQEKQLTALKRQEPFSIQNPKESLRKRLIDEQNLPYADIASLGARYLAKIPHWPKDDNYIEKANTDALLPIETNPEPGKPVLISLAAALQIAAQSSRDYQTAKERVFSSALSLDLSRHDFRFKFAGLLRSELSRDLGATELNTPLNNTASTSLSKKFQSGVQFMANIGIDLAKLLTSSHESAYGIFADASISIPLLRGSASYIVAESLTQAERDVVYAIWDFERFKQDFAVSVASQYLGVLQQLDQIANAEENYRQLIISTRRVRRLTDAGRLPQFQLGQAMQDELSARSRWISAKQSYGRSLDAFKSTLGLPVDAKIELAKDDLSKLADTAKGALLESIPKPNLQMPDEVDSSLAEAELESKLSENQRLGPYELTDDIAVKIGLKNRLDLRVQKERVFDADRNVIVAADALRAELTLLGSTNAGERRSGVFGAESDNGQLRPEKGFYSALLTLDLPFDRKAEQIAFRQSYITLEQTVRDFQDAEDRVKLDIRNDLRDLVEFREGVQIQALALDVAKDRVRSTDLFLQAGRAEIRDLLEAQEALISAQNALTSALISYRVAELSIQRDMGVLQVNEKGLWQEMNAAELKSLADNESKK